MAKQTHKKKGGRKPILDVALVAAALAEMRGNIAAVAMRFKVGRSCVYEFIERTPGLQVVLHDAREGMLDHAESALHGAVLRGEAWAVCFFLKTRGKNRGYTERHEHSGPDGDAIPVRQYVGISPDQV